MDRLDVFRFQGRIAFQQHVVRPTIGQSALDMLHGQARSFDDRLTAKDSLVAGDVLLPIHAPKLDGSSATVDPQICHYTTSCPASSPAYRHTGRRLHNSPDTGGQARLRRSPATMPVTQHLSALPHLFECIAIWFPSVSTKKAMNPLGPMPVLGMVTLPPAFSTRPNASLRSGSAFR